MELMLSQNPLQPPTPTYEKPVAKPTHLLTAKERWLHPILRSSHRQGGNPGPPAGPLLPPTVSQMEIESRPSKSPLLSPSQLSIQPSLIPYEPPDLRPAAQPTPKIFT